MTEKAEREDFGKDLEIVAAYRAAEEREARLLERPCSEGHCVELYNPETGEGDGGWGPVGCPCQAAPADAADAEMRAFVAGWFAHARRSQEAPPLVEEAWRVYRPIEPTAAPPEPKPPLPEETP